MTENFKNARFNDYMVCGWELGETGTYYLASYDPTKKVKGLFPISREDFSCYCVDKYLLDSAMDDNNEWEMWTPEEQYNYIKFATLSQNRGFIREMWLKLPLYKIFTDDEGCETVILNNGKQKRLI